VEGQTSAVDVLVKSISTGRAAHAYLFSGARGCGKTTVARIVAKSLNCTSSADNYEPCCKCSNCVSITNGENLDVIEIDGASNNGVEEIRELKSHVSLAPFNSRFKVYIIDEVHMLSTAAFNALLKTLEEPPEYVVFILATTEPHKIPVTIRSRCQHIPFHRINSSDILHRLEFVCKKESLEYENEALWEIARQADGALRDALSLLDQAMSLGKGKILLDDVSALVGGGSLVALQRWLSVWRKGGEESFVQLNDMFQRGASAQRAIEELFYISRNLWIAREFGNECIKNAGISKEEYDYIVEECELWSSKSLEHLMLFLSKLLPQIRVGMRTDVIVGILMSRRSEIMTNDENNINYIHPETAKNEHKQEISKVREAGSYSVVQNQLSKNEVKRIKTVDNKSFSVKQDSNAAKHDDISCSGVNDSSSLEEKEGFSPLDDEIRNEFLKNLRSNEFALFCALLDSVFLYSLEQNEVCIIIKYNYLFHFLSNERNSLIFTRILRAQYPQCKLKIFFKEKFYEYGEINNPIDTRLQLSVGKEPFATSGGGADRASGDDWHFRSFAPPENNEANILDESLSNNSTDVPDKPEPKNSIVTPQEKINVAKTGSALHDAVYSATKFMRGEVVMHRIAYDKAEELDIS
jgi:DNA polymerase-3 subunit gamma/tau